MHLQYIAYTVLWRRPHVYGAIETDYYNGNFAQNNDNRII